ncbi:unnamed protein product, partial [Polarella glacialis]
GGRALELCKQLQQNGQAAAGLCLACPAPPQGSRSELISDLRAPVLLTWAKDDSVLPYDGHESWLQELRARQGRATIFASVEAGGHRIDKMAGLDDGLASKLADWPDLVTGPLSKMAQ